MSLYEDARAYAFGHLLHVRYDADLAPLGVEPIERIDRDAQRIYIEASESLVDEE